jgi:hypothetical protein
MPFCPACRVEYREGFTECSDCHVPLVVALPPEEDWVEVYNGSGLELHAVESELESLGIPFSKVVSDVPEATFGAFVLGPDITPYAVSVPVSVYQDREAEILEAVAVGSPEQPADAAAIADAEEDWQVTGCPNCLRYFHQPLPACPGCGGALLPAVECFREGQTAPEAVVIGCGSREQMQALEERLLNAGFHPRLVVPDGWPTTVVELPWAELTDRTAEADRLLQETA